MNLREKASAFFNQGGNRDFKPDEAFEKAHRNVLWIATILLLIAIARPGVTPGLGGGSANDILVPGSGLKLAGRIATICLVISATYFVVVFRHETRRAVRKGSKIGELSPSEIDALAKTRADETSAAFDRWKSTLNESTSKIERYDRLCHDMETFELAASAVRDLSGLVEMEFASRQYADNGDDDSEGYVSISRRSSQKLIDKVRALAALIEQKPNPASSMAIAPQLPEALALSQELIIDVDHISKILSDHQRELRALSSDLAGEDRRHFRVVGVIIPYAYVVASGVLALARWF